MANTHVDSAQCHTNKDKTPLNITKNTLMTIMITKMRRLKIIYIKYHE